MLIDSGCFVKVNYLHLVMLEVHSCIAIELSCPVGVFRAPGSGMCPHGVAQAERRLYIQRMQLVRIVLCMVDEWYIRIDFLEKDLVAAETEIQHNPSTLGLGFDSQIQYLMQLGEFVYPR